MGERWPFDERWLWVKGANRVEGGHGWKVQIG